MYKHKLLLFCLSITIVCILPVNARAERFFDTHSTWYEPISNSAGDDPLSAAKIIELLKYDPTVITNYEWAPTIWKADSTTPKTAVLNKRCVANPSDTRCTTPPAWISQGWNLNVPIPAGAVPGQNQTTLDCWPNYCSDGRVVIMSADGKTAWEMAGAVYFPSDFTAVAAEYRGKWAANYFRRWDLTEDGVNYPYDGLGGPTEMKVPLLHGVITYDEVVNEGAINHALAMSVDPGAVCQARHVAVYPSGITIETSPDRTNTQPGCLKGGERFYLDSSVNCETLNTIYPMVKMVCRALKTYGAIFISFGDSSIYIENNYGKSWSWNGIKGGLGVIPFDKLRVSLPIYPKEPVTDTQAPTVPANLAAIAISSSQINLTWTASTDNVGVSGYKVYRNGALVATVTKASYADTGLSASTSYTYTISAFDSAGNSSAQSAVAKATTAAPINILSNGGFETGTAPWSFYTNATGSFLNDAVGKGSAKAAHITISAQGTNVQLSQIGFVLQPNTQYTLSFKAYSNRGHDVSVSLLKNLSPYTNYGLSRIFNLTTGWADYSMSFTTAGFTGPASDGRLMFWFSPYDAGGDQYFIDDVLLAPVS